MTDPQVIVIEDDPATRSLKTTTTTKTKSTRSLKITSSSGLPLSSLCHQRRCSTNCPMPAKEETNNSSTAASAWSGFLVPTTNCFTINPCLHKFCISCMNLYIKAKVEDSVVSVRCPDPSCKTGILEPELCKNILPYAVFDRWGLRLCKAALGSNKFYCPYKDCSALLLDEGKMVRNSQYPHCRRRICATCKVPRHKGISCEEFEKGRGDLMLRELVADQKWKRSPHCKMFVEKTEGCSTMQCRCQRYFCYNCGCSMNLSREEKCRKNLH